MARIMGVDPTSSTKSVGPRSRVILSSSPKKRALISEPSLTAFESEKVTEEEAPIQDRARNYARTLAPQILEAYGQKYGNEVNTDPNA